MFTEFDLENFAQAALERANMTVEARPVGECEPFHFSQEFKDVALRHVWSINRAREAREAQERGFPRWI